MTVAEFEAGIERLRLWIMAEMKSLEARLLRYILTLFVPLLLGVYGTALAVLLKG